VAFTLELNLHWQVYLLLGAGLQLGTAYSKGQPQNLDLDTVSCREGEELHGTEGFATDHSLEFVKAALSYLRGLCSSVSDTIANDLFACTLNRYGFQS